MKYDRWWQLADEIVGRLFGRNADPLMAQADTLVQVANVNAIGAFLPLLEKFPVLQNANDKHWDFMATIAGVFVAATRLRNLRLEENREKKLMNKVSKRLNQWDPKNGLNGFGHCKSFFEKTFDALTREGHEARFVASDTIGSWIVWDILDRPPESEEERRLVRTVGVMITHNFFNWWDEEKIART